MQELPKQRITIQISNETAERARDAVYWTAGLTLTSLTEQSLCKFLDRLENKRKAKFPRRNQEIKTGRPTK